MTHSPPDPVSRTEPIARSVLEGARRRDPEASGQFFDAAFPVVYGLVFRLLGDRAAAEDATQEALIKVHRAIDRLDPDRDPVPWLTTIAYNVCRDRWRSVAERVGRRSASIEDGPEVAHVLRAESLDPEEAVLANERERMVQEALRRLPEAAREVIVLHDYQGLSHDVVAEMIGASHAAVRKRYSRALQSLGEILREMMDR